MSETPHKNNVRKLWQIAEAVLLLDLTAPDLITKLQTLQRRAEDTLAQKQLGAGNPYNLALAREESAIRRKLAARNFNEVVKKAIDTAIEEGAKTNHEIAEVLNKMNFKPWRAEKWTSVMVFRARKAGEDK